VAAAGGGVAAPAAGAGRGGGVGRAAAAAAGVGAASGGRCTEYSNQMAQKIRLSTVAMPSTVPNGKVSTGFTVMTPASGELISTAD
jgi:hypothetical protein